MMPAQYVIRKWAAFRWAACLLAGLFSTQMAAAEIGFPGDEEMAILKTGEILVQTVETGTPGVTASATAWFNADAESIWDIIGYCQYAMIFTRGLKTCKMLEGDRFDMVMHHRLRESWFMPMLDYTFRAQRNREGFGRAKLIDGNLKVLEASWRLTPLEEGGGVIVVHQISIQSRFPAPKWLVRRSLRRDLPDMLACIRGLTQSPATAESVQRDLSRCPGQITEAAK